jgi:two-component system, OmpR family, response regulator
VLDVMLPDTDGFEVVARLRRDGLRVPVIFLTARDTQADKVNGLTIGGDDYLTKPFGLEELAARIRTVLRRTRPATDAGPVLTSPTSSWTRTATRYAAPVIWSSCPRPSSACCAT